MDKLKAAVVLLETAINDLKNDPQLMDGINISLLEDQVSDNEGRIFININGTGFQLTLTKNESYDGNYSMDNKTIGISFS